MKYLAGVVCTEDFNLEQNHVSGIKSRFWLNFAELVENDLMKSVSKNIYQFIAAYCKDFKSL